MRSILILGGSGFVGTHLALTLREKHKVFLSFNKKMVQIPGVTPLPLQISNRDWIKRVVLTTMPDTILYVVGKNDLKWCEDNTREAEYAHLGGLGNLTSVADRVQAKIIYLSNGFVFDGNKGNYHAEDVAVPDTALGKAKLSGENFLKGRSLNWLIIRSAPILGRGNGTHLSFFDEMRISLSRGIPLKLSSQQYHNYVSINEFTDFMEGVVSNGGVRNKVLHYGGLTKVSPYELGCLFAKRFGFKEELIQEDNSDGVLRNKIADFSINSTETIELLKFKPLFLEQSFDLLEKNLIGV